MKLITFIQIVVSVCVTAGKQEFVVNSNEFEVGISENEAGLEVHEDKNRLLRGNELGDGNSESGEHVSSVILLFPHYFTIIMVKTSFKFLLYIILHRC